MLLSEINSWRRNVESFPPFLNHNKHSLVEGSWAIMLLDQQHNFCQPLLFVLHSIMRGAYKTTPDRVENESRKMTQKARKAWPSVVI